MKKMTDKELSVQHEDFIAIHYGGVRSKSSGGAPTDDGDIRAHFDLFECKATRKPIPAKMKKEFEKIALEAYREDRIPNLCYRFYDPTSLLADKKGWVDFTIRLTRDDFGSKSLWR